jgi:hypothetical protein
LPPEGDQSWREREALHLTDTDAVNDEIAELARPTFLLAADPVFEPMEPALEPAAEIPEPYVPVREPVAVAQTAHRGAGGVMLLLVGMVGLVTVALAVPDILTPEFWRTQWAAVMAKPAAMPERVASIPAPVAAPVQPPAPMRTVPDRKPALNTGPLTSNESPADAAPPPDAAPPASAMPEAPPMPRPETRTPQVRRTMVIGRDGRVRYEDAGKPVPVRRASRQGDRNESGIYAMTPGPDGVLRREFFPAGPESDSQPSARDNESASGVYAMAPGPDGVLRYRYFPSDPR